MTGQRDNFILWLPVFFGLGILGYFQLLNEPPIWLSGVLTITSTALILWIIKNHQPIDKYALVPFVMISIGFVAAQTKTHLVSAPLIENSKSIKEITGRVIRLEQRPKGPRVWLDKLNIDKLAPSNTPKYIRVTFSKNVELNIADEIKFRARLRPPSPPSIANSYDFQRRAWFLSLGGLGFSIGQLEILYTGNDASQSVSLHLTDIRKKIVDIINQTLPNDTSAITAALITGDRSGISEEIKQIMRDSGLAHLLAISGLHMGLVAGVLFFAIRAGLALSERLTLYYPIKKWAALAAIPGILAYLLIAGAPLPTQRAFIMTILVLVAVIFDRVALSMRLVALAALGVLALFPESLFSPSFQMSFAAVTGLVALFDSPYSRQLKTQLNANITGRVSGYVLALSASTFVASITTMPFAIYHFGRIADYGLAANLLAVPIMAFWVMPWAVISMLLMPLGLGFIGLVPMGWGVALILEIAKMVAGWPGSYQLVATIPDIALAGFIIAGLWLCLWRGRVRLYFLPLIPLAIIISYFNAQPNIILSADGKLIATRQGDRAISLSNLRRNRFEADIWKQRLGLDDAQAWPRDGAGNVNGIRCDSYGCVFEYSGHLIAFPRSQSALYEDCKLASVVIATQFPITEKYCVDPNSVIDRYDLRKKGGHLIYLSPDNIHIETVQGTRGKRLWTGTGLD